MATGSEINDFTFPSDIFADGATIEIQSMKDHLSVLLWVK